MGTEDRVAIQVVCAAAGALDALLLVARLISDAHGVYERINWLNANYMLQLKRINTVTLFNYKRSLSKILKPLMN